MSRLITTILLALLGCNCLTASVQDKPSPKKDSPEAVFAKLRDAANQFDWPAIRAQLTESANDNLVKNAIKSSISLLKRELPHEPKGLRTARQQMKSLFDEQGLSEISFPDILDWTSSPSDKEIANYESQLQQATDSVLKKVKDVDSLLTKMTEIMDQSPIPNGGTLLFRFGDLSELDEEEKHATGIVNVDFSKRKAAGSVHMAMLPTPIRFSLVDGSWKYDGVDKKEMRQIIEESDLPAMETRSKEAKERDDKPAAARENFKPEEVHGAAAKGSIELSASWIPFTESVYKFGEKWPELAELKPALETKSYDHQFFQAMLPPKDATLGQTWPLEATKLLPLVKQFHAGATLDLHHRGPTGAFACLVGQNRDYFDILIRLHGEILLDDGASYYTPSQFQGRLTWNRVKNRAEYFRFEVPPRKTNVDVNRFIGSKKEGADPEKRQPGRRIADIGYTPEMKLVGGAEIKTFWTESIDIKKGEKLLAKQFYKFAEINWMEWEEAVAQSQRTGKPLHIVALFGTLDDESC